MRMIVVAFASAVAFLGTATGPYAAQQPVVTKLFLMKDPPAGPQARKIAWKVKDADPDLSVVGDPTVTGATLRVVLLVSNHCSVPPCEDGGGDQCFDLPANGWSRIGSSGFKYGDASLANGPVKVASIKRTTSGILQIKAILQGNGIGLSLGDELGYYGVDLALGGGDDYTTGSSGAVPNPNSATTFRVKNETGGSSYVTPCSPSGAFVD